MRRGVQVPGRVRVLLTMTTLERILCGMLAVATDRRPRPEPRIVVTETWTWIEGDDGRRRDALDLAADRVWNYAFGVDGPDGPGYPETWGYHALNASSAS